MEVYETTILRPLHKLIKVFASCFVRSALGRRRLPSFFPAYGFWTVQDGQAAIIRCWLLRAMQHRLRMPTRTQRAGRAAAAALTALSSQVLNLVRQHVKNLGAHWNIRHHWVQLVSISCSLACNAPLRSFAVFSHTLPTEARKGCTVMYTLQPQPREMKQSSELTVPTKQRPSSTKYFYFKAPSYFNCKDTLVVQRSYNTQRKQLNQRLSLFLPGKMRDRRRIFIA